MSRRRQSHRLLPSAGLAVCLVAAALLATPLPSHALVANCEDGSVVLAKRREDVRCSGATLVEPGAAPRLGPPRGPDASFRHEARKLRELARERDLETQIERALAVERAQPRLAPSPPAEPTRFELGTKEHDALARFIELSQQRARAAVAHTRSDTGAARMRIAHSPAFETRLRGSPAARAIAGAGAVLVFALDSDGPTRDAARLSFAQRGTTFRPQASAASHLGWIVREGEEPLRGTSRLGYVVLPVGFDLERPLVVFWGDAVAAVKLGP